MNPEDGRRSGDDQEDRSPDDSDTSPEKAAEEEYRRLSPWTTQGSFAMRSVRERPRPHGWEEGLDSDEVRRLSEAEADAQRRRDEVLRDPDDDQR